MINLPDASPHPTFIVSTVCDKSGRFPTIENQEKTVPFPSGGPAVLTHRRMRLEYFSIPFGVADGGLEIVR